MRKNLETFFLHWYDDTIQVLVDYTRMSSQMELQMGDLKLFAGDGGFNWLYTFTPREISLTCFEKFPRVL